MVKGEREIFGQRIDPTGAEVDVNDFRISQQAGSGDGSFDAANPDVTVDTDTARHLVVWEGSPDDGVSIAREIFRISDLGGHSPDAIQRGANDFRITDMGGIGTRERCRAPRRLRDRRACTARPPDPRRPPPLRALPARFRSD